MLDQILVPLDGSVFAESVLPVEEKQQVAHSAAQPTLTLTLVVSLVQNPTLGGTSVLEVTTIVAMLVWAIVGWLLGRLVWLVMSRPR